MASDLPSLTATAAECLIDYGKPRPEALIDARVDRIASRDPSVMASANFDPVAAPAGRLPPELAVAGCTDRGEGRVGWVDTPDAASDARAARGVVIAKTVTTKFVDYVPGRRSD